MVDDEMIGRLQINVTLKIFVMPTKNGEKNEYKEIVEKMRIPKKYSPDKSDKFYRPPNLVKEGKDDYFHVIAGGKFAEMIAAKLKIGNEVVTVAAKRYNLNELDSTKDGYTRLRREVQISRFHRHENIVKFYEAFPESTEAQPEIPTHLWLVTERMDHTLEKYFEHIRGKDDTNEPVLRDMRHLGALLTQLLRALDYLHQRGIMHRDITPRNIGMNQNDFIVKLFDFGLARETNPKLDHTTNVDTPYIYKPIEVFMRAKYNTGVDIWAAALVAIEMLGMKLFMPTGSDEEIAQKIRSQGAEKAVKNRQLEVLGIPDDRYKSIFGRPVIENPKPSRLHEILGLLFKRLDRDIGPLKRDNLVELLERMLDPNMRNRYTANDCLQHTFLSIMNAKYENRSMKGVNAQPKDDNGMRMRNESDRDVLLKELVYLENQKIYVDSSEKHQKFRRDL